MISSGFSQSILPTVHVAWWKTTLHPCDIKLQGTRHSLYSNRAFRESVIRRTRMDVER